MISREEYNNALDIVEEYHKQLNLSIVKRSFSKIEHLKEGDFVEVLKVDTNTKRNLTLGKKYKILGFSVRNYSFIIEGDNGKRREYRSFNRTFKPIKPNYA
jgi:hypothetical protein|tara:strand:+ start:4519 stop:4821 length:303 start_codon:yes stop_codon:yes gene_type:complete